MSHFSFALFLNTSGARYRHYIVNSRYCSENELALLRFESACAEIGKLDLLARVCCVVQHNVLWLEVTVNDAFHMAVCNTIKYLVHKASCSRLTEPLLLGQPVEEFATITILSDDVVVLVLTIDLVHFDDVRVLLHYPHLIPTSSVLSTPS